MPNLHVIFRDGVLLVTPATGEKTHKLPLPPAGEGWGEGGYALGCFPPHLYPLP